jgi:hypothetical protein
MKKTLAIGFSELISQVPNNALGPVVVAGVVVDSNFFRKFSYMKPAEENMEKYVERTRKGCWSEFAYLQPETLKADRLKIMYSDAIISVLNANKEFWKECNILITPFEEEPEMLRLLEEALPHNLRNVKKDLHMEKWKFDFEAKPIKVATLFAKYIAKREFNEIKNVWGEVGSGLIGDPATLKFIASNPDCPKLRKL